MLCDVFEVLLHLDELSNLELLRKGVYRLSLTLAAGAAGRPCMPFTSSAAPARLGSLSRLAAVEGTDAASEVGGIDEERYVSRAVLLRYTDERFALNETACFRCELPRARKPGGSRLTLTVRLLRAECTQPDEGPRASPPKRAGATPFSSS